MSIDFVGCACRWSTLWIRALALVAVAAAAPGFAVAEDEIIVAGYGGSLKALQSVVHPMFEAETGLKAVAVTGMNPAKMRQMVEQNAVDWDVVLLGPEQTAITGEYLEKIDYSVVKPAGIPEEGIYEHGVASDLYSVVLVWRKDVYGDNPPRSWKDFWDVEKFPGRRTLPRRTIDIVELALMGDGVEPAAMYPIDVDRAINSIERIEPHVAKFWKGGNEPIQLLLSGEVDMAAVWVTRVVRQLEEDAEAPLDFTWNQHLMAQDVLAIPKGSKRVAAAQRYINFRLRPDVQGIMLNLAPIGPSSSLAQKYVEKGRERFNPTSEVNLPLGHFRDPAYWLENLKKIDARVSEVLGV